jgi:D-3-phosphoglycerate dehydrogenase
MYKIKVMNKISQEGLDIFSDQFEVGANIENPDAILLRSAYIKGQELPESVLAISRAGIGVNNIDVDKCTSLGIPVFNTPGANANAVKEIVVAALYLSSRNIVEAVNWVSSIADRGEEIEKMVEDGKAHFVGPEIAGKTLGVIGLGAIGVLVANAAAYLGMTVFGYDPYISIENAWGLSQSVMHVQDLSEIFRKSDYITLHVPLNDDTANMINSEAIALMKDSVRILNFARGELVNSEDVVEALESGKVTCYVTDFPNKTVTGKKGVIAVPHLGASTPESEVNCAEMAVRELKAYLERGAISNSVNFNSCDPPFNHSGRVALFNKNIPGMLSQITTIASGKGYNIENLTSTSKKGSAIAYTIIDLDRHPEDDFVDSINNLEGVVRIRVIC